ncbi:DUF488 family protein [Diaminobutyricimonas sp. LJ205]|uniref:DUF488 domain-containing protein n=1 Tax=Diaminobutyricimonas sp. LJ205 TaxID=2683590 RepID=UPI0018DFDE58|nr:DUF488 domain-containing protein [Diaminobutyricimonas sp. LJ205]
MSDVIGIGYEGLDQDGLLSRLSLRGVATVVDVRLSPISRKRGLSKTALAARLRAAGIDYEHLPALGNPRDNREGFADTRGEAGRAARTRFEQILESTAAKESLERVRTLARKGGVALLCFEADEQSCHRELVLAALHQSDTANI